MPQPLIELGGHAHQGVMAISPANGFVPETYLPLLPAFEDDYRVISVPPRALWGEGLPPDDKSNYSWLDIADDMRRAFEQYGLSDVVGIGHSIGGVTTVLSAIQQPQLFKALVLLDPVILPEPAVQWMARQREEFGLTNKSLYEGAMRRRYKFQSTAEAFDNFHGKSIFADWSDEVLRLYVEHGTVPCEDGLRCLHWHPKWEAFYFGTYFTEIWDELPKLNALEMPIAFINGGTSDTFMPDAIEALQEIVPNADYLTVEGHGHLFPQSAPQQTQQIICTWLDKVL